MTIDKVSIVTFAGMKLYLQSAHLYVIAFSHKKLALNLIGKLYLDPSSETYRATLDKIKKQFNASETMHLSTCNRCEFYLVSKDIITKEDTKNFFIQFYSHLSASEKEKIGKQLIFKKDEKAVRYLMEVASSLQSMVVGEREIITQIRNAYEHCRALHFTGDLLRLVMKKLIETGKEVFDKTDIAKSPVSVASLATRSLNTLNILENAKVTVIGSGITMQTFMKYFHQDKYQYTFVSRKKENSHALQQKYGGRYMSLSELKEITSLPTDVLVVCTAAPAPVADGFLFEKLFDSHFHPIVVDLSNPSDIAEDVFNTHSFHYIGITSLKKQAKENLLKRKASIFDAQKIIQTNLEEFLQVFRERCVENIIREIPVEFKEYKQKALDEVFKKKIESLDQSNRKILQEIVDYIEGKYNAVTYKKLKNILLQ